MKLVQVVPVAGMEKKLKALLKETERELRGKPTAFIREREGRWKHVKYRGSIVWDDTKGGILVAEVRPHEPGGEWQLLQSFIGYLDRHLAKYIQSITIFYLENGTQKPRRTAKKSKGRRKSKRSK